MTLRAVSNSTSSGNSSVVTVSGSRNFQASDNGNTLAYAGSTPITLTIPQGLSSSFSTSVAQLGTGTITVNNAAGVALGNIGLTNGPQSFLTITAVGTDSYGIQNPISNGFVSLGTSAIPFIVFASGSWTAAANGVLSVVPTQTTAWPNAYIYMPANSITGTNPAGWYYGEFSTVSAVTLYNNTYNVATGGVPVIPTKTPFVAAAGSNTTQDTMPIQGPTMIIPGNALGKTGAFQLSAQLQAVSNTNTKTAGLGFGSSNTIFGTLNTTNANLGEIDVILQNLGSATRQMFRTKTNSASASAPTILTQDTTANIAVAINLNCGTTANDWILCHYGRFAYQYGV